ncbi:MAG: cutinase family protein [Gordonia sp. (in: high G+C Gram-positive bacteria)]|uniref:cutinase family protein n=1 Tax=Gordonia sp. (in: high G+C Gram-positive bacteria) TaxID=84139 RepID=UPI003BB6F115
MPKRLLLVLSALLLMAGLAAPVAGRANASGCADVHLLFARGTQEAGGAVGNTGQAMYQSLAARFPGKDVRVSPIHYQASDDFQKGTGFLKTVSAGVRSAQSQVQNIAGKCRQTKIVLGGFSQGGVIVTYAASDDVLGPGLVVGELPTSLRPDVARKVAGVITFGAPADRWFRDVGLPPMRTGSAYRHKTREYCIRGDNICDGGPINRPNTVHGNYAHNGMTGAAANFVARYIR